MGLDSRNSDDKTVYIGVDYNLALEWKFKDNGPQYYIKLERNGPYDYSAPVAINNTLINNAGQVKRYKNKDFIPHVEEFWLDLPLGAPLRFKTGLYTYEVGNGFAVSGNYENYAATLYQEWESFSWRLHYVRPDMENKTHRGPVVRQEKEQGMVYEPNAANLFALDAQVKAANHRFWPYLSVLADYTSPGKRFNVFSAPVKNDLLGTIGLAWDYQAERFALRAEAAHNFGRAESASADFKNVEHAGYLAYVEADYLAEKISPHVKFLAASGNKLTPEFAESGAATLTSGRNRAFSYYSPTNFNISDSVSSSNVEMLPIVAMSGGNGLNYGILRPGTLYSADFENLLMPCVGFELNPIPKLTCYLDFYYLSAFERGVGTWQGVGKYLSRDLGCELDLIVDYQLNKNTLISFLGGYFIPGRYYKERRDDAGSWFAPLLRGDGDADNAYQLEMSLEFSF